MSESNGTRAHRQSQEAAADYLKTAIRVIDAEFGDGYAKANPHLVGVFMTVCAAEYPSLL